MIFVRYLYNDLIGWGIRICNCRLLHCPPLFNRIQAVCLPLCLRVLPGNPPLLQSHWRIVYLSRTSFVQSTCYCCHSYYSASFFSLSLFLSLSPLARPFYNLIGALSTSHEPHSFSRPATVVTHTTQPLFFLFLSFFHLARLPSPSTISLVHCLPLTNLIRSVGLLRLSLILLSLFFSLSLFLSLSPVPRLQTFSLALYASFYTQ